ncbi:MAG: TonB-dependent receptor [Rhodocyclales bacterium GWA2_65_20]|nr:MAG: TonB-dependent receptor [Rhodocyclales bacterium GWA2_65_20]
MQVLPKRLPLLVASLFAYGGAYAASVEQELETVVVEAAAGGSYKAHTVQVGTFRDMAPIDVPQSSNVVTRELLDSQATNTLFGALRNTAGVSRAALSGSVYDNLALRGITLNNRNNYRLNGSLPVINLLDTPLENKERVEVLKGASSLYYGFVPPSGMVNMVTKRAGKVPVKTVTLSANDHGGANIHGDFGSRFGDKQQFGASVNLVTGKEDTGIDNFSGKRELASLALDWRASDALSFKLDLEHYRKDASEQASLGLPAAVGGKITLPANIPNERNLAGEWQKYEAKADNALLRMDYALSDDWSLLVEAGRAYTERDRNFGSFRNYNLATGEGSLQVGFNRDQWWKNENYRTELFGYLETAALRHELTLGYTRNDYSQSYLEFPNQTVSQNLYSPRPVPELTPAAATGSNDNAIEDGAWYVSDRVKLGERWQAMLGMRFSDFKQQTTIHKNGAADVNQRYSVTETTPAFSLLYKLTPHTSLYGSYLEGLSPATITGLVTDTKYANVGSQLPASRTKQKEVGIKSEQGGLLLQAAYFDLDSPTTADETGTDGKLYQRVNGLSRYRGLELAASGELNKQWALSASAVLMSAEQGGMVSASTKGKVPANTPEKTANAFVEYRVPSVAGLALSGGVHYIGKRAVNAANQAFVDSYHTLSLGTRYATRLAGKRTTFQLVLDNATDERYWASADGLLSQGAPRTLKLTTRVDL